MCRKCVIEEENPFHILCECKALTNLRQKHLTQRWCYHQRSWALDVAVLLSERRSSVSCFRLSGNSWPISLCAVVPSCRCHDPRCNNNILVICLWQELIRVRSCWQPRTCSVWEPCWVWHTVTVAFSALLGILFSLHFRYSWLIH